MHFPSGRTYGSILKFLLFERRATLDSQPNPVLHRVVWLKLPPCQSFAQNSRQSYFCIAHKALHQHTPLYLSDKLHKADCSREMRSTNALLLVPTLLNKKATQSRSFSGNSPTIWNSLPKDLRCNPSYLSFKKDLKLHLLNKYWGP